uniref:Uncharacterized protein n=1 Tax=Pseudomonas phage Cygsa01 TaxID=3138529 RepID=A0AAU6W478_9VIRU
MNRDELQHLFEQKAPIPLSTIERFAGTYRFKPNTPSHRISTHDMWTLKEYGGKWAGFQLALDIGLKQVSPAAPLIDPQLLIRCRRVIKKCAPEETGLVEDLKLAINTGGPGGVHCGAHVDYDPASRIERGMVVVALDNTYMTRGDA